MDQSTYNAANKARIALEHGAKTLVVVNGDKIVHHSVERGLVPLVDLATRLPEIAAGAVIGDRVVGRTAALLAASLKPRAVFGLIMTDEAIDLLNEHGILATWHETVPYLVERGGGSRYKADMAMAALNDPALALTAIGHYLTGQEA
ncbi:MAG: DUF1893 domain-containing protein [Propionibacteriaceae bacterium]|nr:DUF1893 domain-containing protein [Propionibacteriaceae bacterium]